MQLREGGVEITVPEQRRGEEEGTTDSVFFNPTQELNRDITVAVLRAIDCETYLDATAASGIRAVRAGAEGYDVTACDVDPDAVELARKNLAANGLDGDVHHRNAKAHLHEHHHDVVDLDPFGTPIPFVDAAVSGTREYLCVTATDTAPLCGAHFESGVRSYSAVPRNTEFHAEMGLRVLLSALIRTAARYDVAASPVLSHVSSHYVRTYLRIDGGARKADDLLGELGYVDHCRSCLWRRAERGLIADPVDRCPNCDADVWTAGPLFLGHPHNRPFLADVIAEIGEEMGTAGEATKLLTRIETELQQPTHYDQHRLTELWGKPAPSMDSFLESLRTAGHEASRTHYGGTTFKTDASVAEIEAAVDIES
ncbi:MAG: tRNA (guanine(26)-N(2))-dimethyltransferase [Natronomonas sp.]